MKRRDLLKQAVGFAALASLRASQAGASQIDESLERLQTDRVDLMQIHESLRMEDADRSSAEGGAIEALEEAKKTGKIRYIGFTGHKDPIVHNRMLDVAAEHNLHFDSCQMPLNLISAVPPLMLKTAANPGGLPIEVFDKIRLGSSADRSRFYKDLASGPFFGANRPGAKVSQGMIDSFWLQGMQAGHKNTFDCIKAFSETDFTEDLKKFDVPTLIIHGDDDQIVPIDAAGRASAKIVENANLIVYSGAPHGLTDTHKDKLNADLLSFLRARDGMIPET